MSFSGKFTPLQLNALGALKGSATSTGDPQGFRLNPTSTGYHGTWKPSGYSNGSLISNSSLSTLHTAVKNIYTAATSDTSLLVAYRKLLKMGNACPALTNTRPATFKPTYAGYGSWSNGTKVEDNYPPRNYPITDSSQTVGDYSYIRTNKGDYAWITGWPGNNSWQQSTDTYKAAYLPSTADAPTLTDYDEYFSDGFIATIARQAYYEMWSGQFNQYQLIVNTTGQTFGFKTTENKNIGSLVSSKTFMSGTFSSINDVSTGDISGVSLAFRTWGSDLLNLGRAIDLKNIHRFGLPSVLLGVLQSNNVSTATKAVDMSLLLAGLSTQEIIEIKTPGYTPTKEQEQKIYKAFTYVTNENGGTDLSSVLTQLNCTTSGITTLADLLNPKKLFPNSLNTLTVPKYNIDRDISTSGKIYYFIYVGGTTNAQQLAQFKQYYTVDLDGIMSEEIALACGAFSMSMQQIKNIRIMDIEKFAPVVANLEVPSKNLALVNQPNGSAVDTTLVSNTLSKQALGSGNNGTYRQCDFMGAAAGYPYTNWYASIQTLITKLMSTTLSGYYTQLLSATTSTAINALITNIETEITNITSRYPSEVAELNYLWSAIGRQLMIEQRALPLTIKDPSSSISTVTSNDVDMFMSQLEKFATDNGDGQTSTVLTNISDTDVIGGQSLVAALREARNSVRLGLVGGELQNNIQNYIDPCTASATATVRGGSIIQVTVTNPSNGYNAANLPTITVYPVNVKRQAVLVPVLAGGGIASISIVDGGDGYTQDVIHIEIEEPPQCQYTNLPQQSYLDTPHSQLMSPELTAADDASMTAAEAIDSVTTCNCDCWT
jgi:hypothetical protein